MRMTHFIGLAAASLATLAIATPATAFELRAVVDSETGAVRPVRRRKISPQAPGWCRRSRGPQAKPKRHRNRLHVSRRTRRKHRRAA